MIALLQISRRWYNESFTDQSVFEEVIGGGLVFWPTLMYSCYSGAIFAAICSDFRRFFSLVI